jgi:hypothetical protein
MDRLTVAYQSALKQTRHGVADRVGAVWSQLGSYRDKDIPVFLGRALPVVASGQRRAVALTSAYMSRKLEQAPVGLDADTLIGAAVRNGVEPAVVYARPFATVWTSLSNGVLVDAAIAAGLARLMATADMDVALSSRGATNAYAGASTETIIGWTRVAEPACCDYCQMIDGARTGPDEPQPLHNRCGCTADPITRMTSADRTEPVLSLGSIISDVVIHSHGELGPVIGVKGDAFTGPNDLTD